MHRARLALVGTALGLLLPVAGCSSDPEAPPEIERKLEADTGTPWNVHRGPDGEVRYLSPERPVRVGEGAPEDMARAFFARYGKELHGTDQPDELRVSDFVTEEDGATHVRFRHYLPGSDVQVFGASSGAHFTPAGELYYAQPGFRGDLSGLSATPRVTEQDAELVAADAVLTRCGVRADDTRRVEGELGVHAPEDAPSSLVWRLRFDTRGGSCEAPEVLVDAQAGVVLEFRDTVESLWDQATGARFHFFGEQADRKTIDVTKTWDILGTRYVLRTEGAAPHVITQRYSWPVAVDIETRVLGEWDTGSPARGAAVDAHFNAMHAFRYFAEVHRRRGTTGLGNDVTVVVHDPEDKGNNAFSRSFAYVFNQVRCGDGTITTDRQKLPLCSAFDVMVHEIAHGVTHYTSGLVYSGESGALNESFSDVMAAAAEHWFETPDPKRNLLIGERLFRNGGALRDLVDPTAFRQSEHYEGLLECAPGQKPDHEKNDNCHVHFNSGIPNRAFSLMTMGGKHRHSRVTVANGIGWERSAELWYRTLTSARSRASFREVAFAQLDEVRRTRPDQLQAVACAWHAVGVLPLDVPIHSALVGLVCPEKASSCDGVASGFVCNSQAEFAAMECKDGQFVRNWMCNLAAGQTRCKHPSPQDWTAKLDAAGRLECE